jgi:hypothetical protein
VGLLDPKDLRSIKPYPLDISLGDANKLLFMKPLLAIAALSSTALLTGCSIVGGVNTNADIHGNQFNIGTDAIKSAPKSIPSELPQVAPTTPPMPPSYTGPTPAPIPTPPAPIQATPEPTPTLPSPIEATPSESSEQN